MAKEKTTRKAAKNAAASKKIAAAKSSVKAKNTKKAVGAVEVAPISAVVKGAAAEKTKAAPTTKKLAAASKAPATPVSRLMKLYRVLGIVYLLQGLAVLLFGRNVTAPLTLQYPSIDTLASEATGHQVVGIANRHVADVHIAWILAIAMIVFAVIHLMLSSAYRNTVNASIERGVNAFRWLSLGIGGGLLVVATALLSGIASITLLLVLFVTVLAAALLTLGVEAIVANNNGAKTRLSHFLCGLATLAAILPWLVFAIGVAGVLLWNGKLPTYLYSIYICQALLVGAFMLATHFRLKRKGKWADGLYGERGYLLLTLLTVTLLSWQIVIGALK